MQPPHGELYCINHIPGADTHIAAIRAAAASAAVRKRNLLPVPRLATAAFTFADRSSVQAFLDTIARLHLAGYISDPKARILLRIAIAAGRNFDPAPRTLAGVAPQKHELTPYYDQVQGLLFSIEPLLQEAAHREFEPITPDDLEYHA